MGIERQATLVYKRGRPVLLEGDARRKKEMPVLEVHPRKEKGSCYECPYGNKKPVVFVTLFLATLIIYITVLAYSGMARAIVGGISGTTGR